MDDAVQFTHSIDPIAGHVYVCQEGPAGTYGFSVSSTGDGAMPLGASFTVGAGSCVDAFERTTPDSPFGDALSSVTVTQLSMPADVQLDSAWVVPQFGSAVKVVGSAAATAAINYFHGATITFYNSPVPPPPPPPPSGGGQGCTPGYWKQSQHQASWLAGYAPSDPFAAHLEDAFPGRTLLQVLGLGGGGLEALGRHAVASLLNAASENVDSGWTPQQVVDAFNGAFPGGDLEGVKNRFEAVNESACPL